MPKFGKVNYKELEKFAKKIEKSAELTDEFFEKASKELAARLLALVIPNTPSDDGVLRRGWTVSSHEDAENNPGTPTVNEQKEYVDGLTVANNGGIFEIEVANHVVHALYREWGHVTRDRKKWVEGSFMLFIAEGDLETELPRILKKKMEEFLKGALK